MSRLHSKGHFRVCQYDQAPDPMVYAIVAISVAASVAATISFLGLFS
ncbi:hypothetical protein [Oricola indica]